MSKSTFYIVASLAGLYIADVELNHGRAVDSLGFYNWNKQQSYNYQVSDKVGSLTDNIGNSYNKDAIKDTINKIPSGGEVKDKAIDLYNDAYSKLVDAQNKVTSSGNDAKEDAAAHLDEAKIHFEKAKQHLSQFGSDAITDAQNKYKAAGNKIYNKLSDIASNAQDQASHISSYFVDKYNDLYDAAGNLIVNSQEKAQELSDYYDDEAQKAKQAYDETQASVLHWRDSQSEAAQAKAKANYEAIQEKSNKAHIELHRWIDKAKKEYEINTEKAYQYAEDQKAKADSAVRNAKDNVKDNANYAYGKANEHAHGAYNYAANVKDDANQAVINAKDNVKDNANENVGVAKNYLSGTAGYFKDKYNELRDGLGRLSVTSQEKAQEIADYYDSQLKEAKAEYDQTQSSWIYWRKAKSEQIQKDAKEHYEYVLKKDNEARNELQKWIEKAKNEAADVAAKAKEKKNSWF